MEFVARSTFSVPTFADPNSRMFLPARYLTIRYAVGNEPNR